MFADVRRFQQLDFWPGVRKTSLSRNLLVRFLLSDTIRGSAAGEELLACGTPDLMVDAGDFELPRVRDKQGHWAGMILPTVSQSVPRPPGMMATTGDRKQGLP